MKDNGIHPDLIDIDDHEVREFLKAVGVVVDSPGQAKPLPHGQHKAEEREKAEIEGPPPFRRPPERKGQANERPEDHQADPYVEKLRQGDGHQVGHGAEPLLEGLGHVVHQPGHSGLITPQNKKQQKQHQLYAQQAALKVLEEKQAAYVSILVMNPQNGEIYACVNVPEFDLNDPFRLASGNIDPSLDLVALIIRKKIHFMQHNLISPPASWFS